MMSDEHYVGSDGEINYYLADEGEGLVRYEYSWNFRNGFPKCSWGNYWKTYKSYGFIELFLEFIESQSHFKPRPLKQSGLRLNPIGILPIWILHKLLNQQFKPPLQQRIRQIIIRHHRILRRIFMPTQFFKFLQRNLGSILWFLFFKPLRRINCQKHPTLNIFVDWVCGDFHADWLISSEWDETSGDGKEVAFGGVGAFEGTAEKGDLQDGVGFEEGALLGGGLGLVGF